jgi:hypothetical protein
VKAAHPTHPLPQHNHTWLFTEEALPYIIMMMIGHPESESGSHCMEPGSLHMHHCLQLLTEEGMYFDLAQSEISCTTNGTLSLESLLIAKIWKWVPSRRLYEYGPEPATHVLVPIIKYVHYELSQNLKVDLLFI